MTEIERKALALVNEIAGHDVVHPRDMKDKCWLLESLCRAIEQHEAFKQEVSDVSEACQTYAAASFIKGQLNRFIITKPDPLVAAMTEAFSDSGAWEPCNEEDANALRAALAKHGLKLERIEHE